MNIRILNKICYFLPNPDKLLSCSKHFTIKRFRNIRWKNRIYFRDNRIKIINLQFLYQYICKEIWYKDGKEHCNDINPKTGLTLPTIIYEDKIKSWCKEGKSHRYDIDPKTGFTLPAQIFANGIKRWLENGIKHNVDVNPETGLTYPAELQINGIKYWYKKGEIHLDEIDPDTGINIPAVIYINGEKFWYKDGSRFFPNPK